MRIFLLIASLLLVVALLPALIVETGSLNNFIYGSEPASQYDNWISHLAERIVSPGYNVYSPWDRQTDGFGGFHVPSIAEMNSWGTIVDEFLLLNWDNVETLLGLSGFPYQVVEFHDTDTGHTLYMLREIPNEMADDNGTQDPYDDEIGAFAWGWGLYIYNPTATRRAVITVPHPCDDFIVPVISTKAFSTWDAEFLMIAGAGREVAWTEVAPYANNKSLSDPTRTINHPFYPAYSRFCSKIRSDTGRREFSAQLHSYDTNLHTGFSSVQISAGYNKTCPNLPIRDLSRFKNDLINQSTYLMIPANTMGTNSDVYVNDYYTVQYSTHPFTYDNDGELITVNNDMDLPAYSQNVIMNYTLNGWNDFDVYEPFFHAEMDELPNCYVQNDNTYKWFYGWNIQTHMWDMEHLFDHALQYYSIWIDDLNEVLDATLNMNDNASPLPPTNLSVFNQSYDYITLQWQKGDDFDFDTYEIQYSTQPIGTGNFSTYDNVSDSYLASPYSEQINVPGLLTSTQYYFKIRARDKNDNYSPLSNEVTAFTTPAKITNFRAIGLDGQTQVKWNVISQSNNQGFRIYRSASGGPYTMQASYLSDASLAGGFTTYVWNDVNVTNGLSYSYWIGSVNTSNVEFMHNISSNGYPRDYFTLYVQRADSTLADSLSFSANPGASSGNDTDYDVIKGTLPSTNYVYGAFWEQYWGSSGTYLQQEVTGEFFPESGLRAWSIRVKSDQLNTPLIFRVDDSFDRYTEKLYLRDASTGAMTDLETGSYTFQVPDSNYRAFTLYWGNLQPTISISSLPPRVYQGNYSQTFYWGANFSFLVDHYNLSIQTDSDSIFMAANLPNTTTSVAYTFPPDLNLHNCRFIVDAYATDGQMIRQTSSYQFGIVPASLAYTMLPGLQMQANIWPGTSLTTQQVFGSTATGWTMDSNGEWWNIPPFVYGLGYWIQKSSPFEYSAATSIQRDSLSFTMRSGWNIIPNPHMCSYQVKDLRFRISGITYSLAEMLDQNLISRGVYVYRGYGYVLTDVIYPQESFLLKYYAANTMVASIIFIPYNNGPNVQPTNPNWVLKLAAFQADSDMDDLIIGSYPNSIDNYDFKYDLPEPPIKPVGNLTRLYLAKTHTDSTFWDLQLNSEFRSAFSADQFEEKIWNFRLEACNANPVNFTVDSSLFPDNYGASIHMEGFDYDIQHGDTFTYHPAQAGIYNGQIIVHNYFTGNEDETSLPTLTGLKVFPNPFNLRASVSYNLNRKGPVQIDVYNVKGQHVRSLQQGLLVKGNHQMVWDGKDDQGSRTSSGVYLMRIKTDYSSKTIKVMQIK
jgi:hypothetical protein